MLRFHTSRENFAPLSLTQSPPQTRINGFHLKFVSREILEFSLKIKPKRFPVKLHHMTFISLH